MRALAGLVGLGLVGCVSVQREFGDVVSADGIDLVQLQTETGSLQYDGRAVDGNFRVNGLSYGRGDGRKKATLREEANDYDVYVSQGALVALGNGQYSRAGVEFDVIGPERMDVDMSTGSSARLENVDGIHRIDARSIYARNVVGDADFYSRGGMDVQILPYTDVGYVNLVSTSGDVTIGLPYGLDYDLNVVGDPDYAMVIDDLGYDTFLVDGVVGVGWRGFRTIQVFVDVTGGDLDIYPL